MKKINILEYQIAITLGIVGTIIGIIVDTHRFYMYMLAGLVIGFIADEIWDRYLNK